MLLTLMWVLGATSCSRSLTDYGYTGGSDKTVDMSTIGPIYNEYPHLQQYPEYNYLPFETRHYLPTNKSIYIIPNSKLNTLGKSERRGLIFIQNFYTDLDNDFNLSKFEKKYAKVLSPEVETTIKQTFVNDSTDIR